ncbi:MAG: HAD-IC family P-type ATPase, partial [Clostridia bacterium]|nr:HAD-IC family P-type ATPase [Clostridia bacterium]
MAIVVSVSLTVVMEGKSEKAFKALAKLSSQKRIKVVRDGEIKLVLSEELLVGDLVIIGQGDKIPADGRIIRSADLTCDESTLTGESKSVQKDGNIILSEDTPLADRKNMVYSGTFVTAGTGAYVVTAVGEEAEIGKIARDVVRERSVSAPLEEKLSRLGKMVSIFGACASGIVFILSFLRLVLLNDLSFDTVQEIFIESIVLIVAAVPEGLPTTV